MNGMLKNGKREYGIHDCMVSDYCNTQGKKMGPMVWGDGQVIHDQVGSLNHLT